MAREVVDREATARDMARAVELSQQYLDLLDEMIDGDLTPCPADVTVRVDGQTVRFSSIDEVAQWLTSK